MYSLDCSGVVPSREGLLISLSFIAALFGVNYLLFVTTLPNGEHAPSLFLSINSSEGDMFVDSPHSIPTLLGSPLSANYEEPRVIYRNAPWKPQIGRWLSQRGASPITKAVSERFFNKQCDSNCSGRGVCNHHLAECRCFHGYRGKGCRLEEEFPCTMANDIVQRESSCGASCDKTKAFCYCGEGTKYPGRPVTGRCGFVNSDEMLDWGIPDPMIFANDTGWCNLDPMDMMTPVKNCYCSYDGSDGRLCNEHFESVCINQCSGNGQCRGGFCSCFGGWYGIDCSIPSSSQSVSLDKWPNWLWNSASNMTMFKSSEDDALQVTVEKPRPLIYVYDLPAEFNSQLLEGRHYKDWCTTRSYNSQNDTIWNSNLYGSEPALLESLLASPHRTTNGDEADFFYVPTLEACGRFQADSAPHTDTQRKYGGLRGYYTGDFHKRAYEHIKEAYPYWNRSGGRDHIWLFSWDEGSCSAPKEIWSSIMLAHWGNTHFKHNYSTSAYGPDRWTDIPIEWRGNHPCYDPSKDIVIPAWKEPNPNIITGRHWARPREERPTLFYFNGNLGNLYEKGRIEAEYSMGIRQKLAAEFGSLPNKDGQLGRQWAPDVTVVHAKTKYYGLDLSESRFCGVLPGDGWSGRMEDSILHGCIPVIIQDGIDLPFENVLDYTAFSVRIAEDELPNMVQILRGINETMVDSMLTVVGKIWQRFTYHSNVKLEAQRQKRANKQEANWATQYNKLVNDDAIATLIQVLHFKLHSKQCRTTSTEVIGDTMHRTDHCGIGTNH